MGPGGGRGPPWRLCVRARTRILIPNEDLAGLLRVLHPNLPYLHRLVVEWRVTGMYGPVRPILENILGDVLSTVRKLVP